MVAGTTQIASPTHKISLLAFTPCYTNATAATHQCYLSIGHFFIQWMSYYKYVHIHMYVKIYVIQYTYLQVNFTISSIYHIKFTSFKFWNYFKYILLFINRTCIANLFHFKKIIWNNKNSLIYRYAHACRNKYFCSNQK